MPTIQLEGMRPIPNLLPKIAAPSPITGLGDGIKTCANLTTILCLRALYNFGAGNTSAAGNEMGIGEWADFLYLPDLPLFFKNFTSPQIPADTVPDFISIDGGQTANYTYDKENESGVESALDFDTAYSIIWAMVSTSTASARSTSFSMHWMPHTARTLAEISRMSTQHTLIPTRAATLDLCSVVEPPRATSSLSHTTRSKPRSLSPTKSVNATSG